MQAIKQENRVDRLVKLLGGGDASEFAMGQVTVSHLADRFSTPFYVYNGDVVQRQIRRLRRALGSETEIY